MAENSKLRRHNEVRAGAALQNNEEWTDRRPTQGSFDYLQINEPRPAAA